VYSVQENGKGHTRAVASTSHEPTEPFSHGTGWGIVAIGVYHSGTIAVVILSRKRKIIG